MKPKKLTPTKNKAQAMVEFAIALPILLMLIYGLLEVGRLLYIYSSVTNASRQAVRWGSTSGQGDGGTPGNTINFPRYQDCAGIRASANRGDALNAFVDADIHIYYDSGPGTAATEYCLPGSATDTSLTSTILAGNTHRIKVRINASFKAIVPKLVPFVNRPINAESARTVISSISISNATATPSKTPTPTFTPTPTASNTPTITSSPTKTLSPTAGPSPTKTKTFTPAPSSTLAPAACAVNYTVINSWGGNNFQIDLTITNNSSTPINGWTLNWSYTAGQAIYNMWNATYTQNGGAVSASAVSYTQTINPNGGTVQIGFQATYSGTNPSPASFTLNGQPCTGGGAVPPTATLTPSLTPTTIPTGVSCSQISHGPETFSGDTMSMVINNTSSVALAVQNVTVTWNHDRGRQGNTSNPSGRALGLISSALNSTIYWTGAQTQAGPNYTITPSPSINIPIGSSTISFKFNFTYFNLDGTERIYINISTPGCGFIDSNT